MDEFDLIRRYFAPLARGFPGSLHLTDDAALIDAPDGEQLVVTKDAISAGVHFIGSENPALVAQKLLRVNLSDLAAMGAKPLCYFLAVMLPRDLPSSVAEISGPLPTLPPQAGEGKENWLARFAHGLQEDQQAFGIHLAGGDSIRTHGTLSFSLTAIGSVPKGQALLRSGAKPGDAVYVSGTLGDSALGLRLLSSTLAEGMQEGKTVCASEGAPPLPNPPPHAGEGNAYLLQRYLLPQPRLALGQQLRGVASACMDSSDGLVQDLGHLCTASRVGAIIETARLPLSHAARQMLMAQPGLITDILSGGDDYELLFTVPPGAWHAVPETCTRIGIVEAGTGVHVLDEEGREMKLIKKGFTHF